MPITRISMKFLLGTGFLLTTALLHGQVETARIIGTVSDQSGAVIPGANITITNVQTNISYETQSGGDGRYESIPLRIGEYRVAAEIAGFRRAVRSGIVLQIQQTAVVDIVLQIGQLSEEVTVSAAPPLLTTTEATQGQVIDNQKIVDLPLNGRDYIQLALLSAGANQAAPGARVGGFSGSGMRATQNNYLLDGVDNNNAQIAYQGRQAETVKPSVDAVQEFKVMTNSYSAEYGRAAGAVVNATLKSGTNEIHGTAYEFLRNEALDAKNFFDLPESDKPPFKRNQYGFSIGGPILRGKTFFFGDYEGTRIRESRTVNNTIPTPTMLKGDFSELLPKAKIYDPLTYDPQTKLRQPFPGNIIPASRFDPISAKLATFYPAPNKPGLTQNFLYNPADKMDRDLFDIKIDHTFGSKDTLSGRYSHQRDLEPHSPSLPEPAWGSGDQASDFTHTGQNVMLSYIHVFSPTFIISWKAAWNRIFTDREPPNDTVYNKELGLKGVDTFLAGMAQFTTSGYTNLGIGATNPNLVDSQNRQVISDLTWIRGKHSVKFGVNLNWLQSYLANPQQALGVFTFNGSYTRNSKTLSEGNAIADLLLGTLNQAQTSNYVNMNQRAPFYHFYVQDEWRATDKLTLNFGLRYQLNLPWVETRNGWANFDVDTDASNPQLVMAQDGSRSDRATIRTDYNDFAPRFGFAYRAFDKTVVRGGYGVYYTQYEAFGGAQYLEVNPPFHYKAVVTTDSVNPTLLLKDGIPEGTVSPQNARNIQTSSYDRNLRSGYSQQWSFSMQRELPGDMLAEVGYYGNKANKLMRRVEGNYALPGAGNINNRRIYRSILVPRDNVVIGPLAGTFRHEASGNSNFHSMQLRLEKRLSRGLSLLGSYIWSRTISDSRGESGSGGTAASYPQNPLDLRSERSLADEHRPHRFVVSYIYDLPFGKGKSLGSNWNAVTNGVLGGWAVAGITTLTSGRRIDLSVRGNPANSSNPNRPNIVSGEDWRLDRDERTLDRFFNTDAFVPNNQYEFGNAGRNLLEGPGTVNFDMAVYKFFRIRENVQLQFRAEAFNALNTPGFGIPNAEVGNLNFGKISGAERPRNLQFGLKLIF